jgi:hypothetical protein
MGSPAVVWCEFSRVEVEGVCIGIAFGVKLEIEDFSAYQIFDNAET